MPDVRACVCVRVCVQTCLGSAAYRLEVWFTEDGCGPLSKAMRQSLVDALRSVTKGSHSQIPRFAYRSHVIDSVR
jgi:hypothetical protein